MLSLANNYRHFRFTSICQRPYWHLPIVSFIFRAAYILQDKYLSQLKMSDTQELIPVEKRYDDADLSADYVKSRIKYPKFVLEVVLHYLEESLGKSLKYSLAVDAGCGPGLMSTVLLAPYFDKVLGVDISESQIEQATLNNKHSNIEYR
ncbi:hypothetical protein EB796_008346 [Bugula neritina]|uniref:Methyltransferase domain-containing protein n=1 Tax=Bugula neritina TaxID=10212 RepID=A0A7J7K5W1_BUGNE|nr:hypothetical protein EB796_008346 [Bugula neritina]